MSDNQPGYRVEYASSSRSKCKGPKPCNGTLIEKNGLRFGTLVDFRGAKTFSWKHWGCVSPKIIAKMQGLYSDLSDLGGFDDLKPEDKERIRKALRDGHVTKDDIPESTEGAAAEGTIFAGHTLADKVKNESHYSAIDPRPAQESVAESEIYPSGQAPVIIMEQDIEGIVTRVMNRLLEPIRQGMRNGFLDINTNITEVRADIIGIRADITGICADIRQLYLSSIRAINSGLHDGSKRPYEILNFVNLEGQEESPDEYDLPLLRNLATFDTLDNEQLNCYVDRYNIVYGRLDGDRTRENKLRKLKEHLGCMIAD